MKRDEWIERLKETRDPGERAKILEILSSLEKEGTSHRDEPPGTGPGGKRAVSGVSLGYVVGALFVAGGAWMVYNGIKAVIAGLKPVSVMILTAVGSLLVILGVFALFRAGRIREIAKEPPQDTHGQDSDGFRPGP
jgi:predicted phage tail protein